MEKKVELEINGRIIRVMPHVVDDMVRFFGASTTKRQVKNPPKELLTIPEPKKAVILAKEPEIVAIKPKDVVLPEIKEPDPAIQTPKASKVKGKKKNEGT